MSRPSSSCGMEASPAGVTRTACQDGPEPEDAQTHACVEMIKCCTIKTAVEWRRSRVIGAEQWRVSYQIGAWQASHVTVKSLALAGKAGSDLLRLGKCTNTYDVASVHIVFKEAFMEPHKLLVLASNLKVFLLEAIQGGLNK